jgi:hypothetical protein
MGWYRHLSRRNPSRAFQHTMAYKSIGFRHNEWPRRQWEDKLWGFLYDWNRPSGLTLAFMMMMICQFDTTALSQTFRKVIVLCMYCWTVHFVSRPLATTTAYNQAKSLLWNDKPNKIKLRIYFIVLNMQRSCYWRILLLCKLIFILTSKRGELPPTAAEFRLRNSDNNSENSVFRFWRRATSCCSEPDELELWPFCCWPGLWHVARRWTSSWTHVSRRRNWKGTNEQIV